jgi:coupling of ubiquitin conjugation to ER degradation protein 1
VAATSERVLSGRGLENPPPSFQPSLPTVPAAGEGSRSVDVSKRNIASQPDLISRYNLQGRLNGKGKEAVPSEEQKRNAWSADKVARAENLKRRREEMVLAARRKMEAKDAGEGS